MLNIVDPLSLVSNYYNNYIYMCNNYTQSSTSLLQGIHVQDTVYDTNPPCRVHVHIMYTIIQFLRARANIHTVFLRAKNPHAHAQRVI